MELGVRNMKTNPPELSPVEQKIIDQNQAL